MAESFNPPDVWSPFGAFSMGVAQGDGRIVHLKGQVALDREGQLVGRHDMAVQVQQALQNIQAVLAFVGGRMEDVISLTQHVTDINAFMACGAIRQAFFSPPFPVTTTVEVKRLYHPDVLVEITAIAEIPNHRYKPPSNAAS